MFYPTKGQRVRVSGHSQEHVIVSADDTASVAEISLRADGKTINERVPFNLLLATSELDSAQRAADALASRIAANHRALQDSWEHIHQGSLLLAESQNSLSRTWAIIRSSQQLIYQSDLVIARARTLDCT